MPNGCVITKYVELSDFLYNGFAIRLRIFSCRLARSYPLFLFLPIAREALPDEIRQSRARTQNIHVAAQKAARDWTRIVTLPTCQ